MEHLLISNARNLRLVNNYGVKKIMRNMLALQQSIKTITDESEGTEFERSKRYYSLFFGSPAVCLLFLSLVEYLLTVPTGPAGWITPETSLHLRRVQDYAELAMRRQPTGRRCRSRPGVRPKLQLIRD